MLNIPKPKITYTLLSEDEINLLGVKDFDGARITVVLRQATPADLDSFESLNKQMTAGKITAREMDERSLAKLIIKWGARESMPTSLELHDLPLESRGVLLTVFQSFCMPSFDLVEESEQGGTA